MATSKASQLRPDNTSESPDVSPTLLANELGYIGLKEINGAIVQEADRRLRFPHIIEEVDKMRKDSMVSAALQLYRMYICNRKWDVEAPVDADNKLKERTKAVKSMMEDMDWYGFIAQASSFVDYGFSVHEIVLRRRLKSNGSRFNDGLIGIKKLPIRAQASLKEWEFSEDGRELTAVIQSLSNLSNAGRYNRLVISNTMGEITIPREKFLLFRADPRDDSPEGSCPLKSAWKSWKLKEIVQESEMNGLARDLNGVPYIKLPARYMSADASEAEKNIYKYYQNVARNIHNNSQAGLVLPSDSDPESKLPLFSFELLKGEGSKGYDTTKIISRLNTEILLSTFADVLQLGNNGSGSFALANSKTNVIAVAIEHRLREIQNVLNNELMPLLFNQNGWDTAKLPKFVFSDLDDLELAEWAKAVQQTMAVGALEADREMLNIVRKKLGASQLPDEVAPRQEYMSGGTSRSGDGYASATGGLNGTSDSVSEVDNSAANLDNK